MKVLSIVVIVAIFLFGLMVSFLNPGKVAIDYVIGQQDISLSLLLMAMFFIGVVVGLGTMALMLWRANNRTRKMNKRLSQVQKEVENLRVVPMTGGQ